MPISLFVSLAANGPWQAIVQGIVQFIEMIFRATLNMGMPSYILTIFIITLIIRAATQPLTNKQMRSTRRMQMLAPEINAIKQRYANDPQKAQRETMRLYKENGASPTAGCLPLLIQMPILIALYQAILSLASNAAYPEYMLVNWFGGTTLNLAEPDPSGFIFPVFAALATFIQTKVTTPGKQGDRSQKIMLYAMPIMFFFIVRKFPVLLAWYWIFFSLIGAAIMIPFMQKWARQDKKEQEEREAKRQEEEERRRARKEAAREAAREREMARREALRKKNGDKEPVRTQPEGYFEMLDDPAYFSEEWQDPEQLEAEMEFRQWLRDAGVIKVKERRVKPHPWSEEEQVVRICFDSNGAEIPLSEMRAKYDKAQEPPQMPSLPFMKKKNK